jgi:hypothetical protein
MKPLLIIVLTIGVCSSRLRAQSDPRIQGEIARLSGCPAVAKTSPPPVNTRVVWRSPSNLRTETTGKDKVAILFDVSYEQTPFYDTKAEADSSTNFTTLFVLKRRNVYDLSGNKLVPKEADFFSQGKWKKQAEPVVDLGCWMTLL